MKVNHATQHFLKLIYGLFLHILVNAIVLLYEGENASIHISFERCKFLWSKGGAESIPQIHNALLLRHPSTFTYSVHDVILDSPMQHQSFL